VLARAASSAGGARPKALVGLHRSDVRLVAGPAELSPDFEPWIVKFDTSSDATLGPLEEAYALMARAAGIDLPETRLLVTRRAGRVRRHFAVKPGTTAAEVGSALEASSRPE